MTWPGASSRITIPLCFATHPPLPSQRVKGQTDQRGGQRQADGRRCRVGEWRHACAYNVWSTAVLHVDASGGRGRVALGSDQYAGSDGTGLHLATCVPPADSGASASELTHRCGVSQRVRSEVHLADDPVTYQSSQPDEACFISSSSLRPSPFAGSRKLGCEVSWMMYGRRRSSTSRSPWKVASSKADSMVLVDQC